MRTVIDVLAGLAILANAVIYGTDVFGAIVLRPAIGAVDDRTLTQLLGHIHRIADRRFPAIGAVGLVAAVAMTAVAAASEHWVSAAAGALAALALITFIVIYNRVSKPVNTTLTTAALADRVPRPTPVSSRPAGTPSSTRESRSKPSRSPHYASRSPRHDLRLAFLPVSSRAHLARWEPRSRRPCESARARRHLRVGTHLVSHLGLRGCGKPAGRSASTNRGSVGFAGASGGASSNQTCVVPS